MYVDMAAGTVPGTPPSSAPRTGLFGHQFDACVPSVQMVWVDKELLHHIPCAVPVVVGKRDKVTPVKYAQA